MPGHSYLAVFLFAGLLFILTAAFKAVAKLSRRTEQWIDVFTPIIAGIIGGFVIWDRGWEIGLLIAVVGIFLGITVWITTNRET